MKKTFDGRVTLPVEIGIDDQIREVAEYWGADAIRNCDGTELPDTLNDLAERIYATYKLCRNDQTWANANKEELQQVYLSTDHIVAELDNLKIDLLKGYYHKQLEVNYKDNPHKYWEVINRTTGDIVSTSEWSVNQADGTVTIDNPIKYNAYSVSFMAYVVWDPVHMYNHLTNSWTTPEQRPYDIRHTRTRNHVLKYLENWLIENKHINVVRFTTFFYNFTLIFNDKAKEKYVDWFGYSASVSPEALDAFEQEYGYRLRPEDIIDQGYHNSAFRVPSKAYKDYIAFTRKFVTSVMKECVDLCHKHGKEAMMFLGDHWMGTEPYSEDFEKVGMDAVVGSVGNGYTMRMISDIKGVKYTEGRFLPYFFPDNFKEGGNPTQKALANWAQARRACMYSPLDRIGYGGYLSLALKFPDFIEAVKNISDEFRTIHDNMRGKIARTAPFKVAVLNAWGHERRWMTNMVAHALWYREIYQYTGMIECLSGMPLDIEFISFDDVLEKGIDDDIKVIINAGSAGTSWSGGEHWSNPQVIAKLREFVYKGGGMIGVGEPTALHKQGHYFQLHDVFGVDRELGFTMGYTKYDAVEDNHFITEGFEGDFDFGEPLLGIRQWGDNTKSLAMDGKDTLLAVNEIGKGRAVYMTGIPYSPANAKLFYKAIFWAAGQEDQAKAFTSDHPNVELAVFDETKQVAVYNNFDTPIETSVYGENNKVIELEFGPYEMKWINLDDLR